MKYILSLFIFMFFMSFNNEGNLHKPPLGGLGVDGFDIQGHRGCRGLMPENTIPAMIKALDLGVTTLEMDVVISKDNKVVVSHEPWFEAEITTRPDGSFIKPAEAMQYNIFQMNYDEIVKYDVGMKPHPRFPQQQKIKAIKPLLADLFDSVAESMKTRRRPFPYFNIETKCLPAGDGRFHPKPEEFVELLMAVIKEKQLEERVIIQSFDFRTLRYLHEKYPSIKTSMLIEDSDVNDFEGQLKRLGFIPQVYSPNHTLIDDELIKQCHDKGMKIIPWTVNDKKEISKLKKMGVDGIITDYPDLIK
jgi:glycerophosphoryl diester phosphodiesterase